MYSNSTSFPNYDWACGDGGGMDYYYTGSGDYYYAESSTGITDRESSEINSPDFAMGGITKQSSLFSSAYGTNCSLSRESSDSSCYDVYHGGSYDAYHGGSYESRNQGLLLSATSSNNLSQTAIKCRQLPCRTFISTGSCPYGDRCVFLHDLGIVSRPIYIRSKRKSRDDAGLDAFFWPTMPLTAVMGRMDSKNMPSIFQPYIVPAPNGYSFCNGNNDLAVYSMWENFLDFCKSDPLSVVTTPRNVPPPNPFNRINPYTGRSRLPIFVELSQN